MQSRTVLKHLARKLSLEACPAPPVFGAIGNFAFADARLNVFRSPNKWVTVFEIVQHYDLYFETCLYLFGNCLREEGYQPDFSRPCVASPEGDSVIAAKDGWWAIDRAQFTLCIKGKQRTFSPSLAEYEAAGITFTNEEIGPGTLKPIQLLRFLCHTLHHPFFVSDDYMRFVLDALRSERKQYLSTQMDLVLQTTEWQHPDIINGESVENIQCFHVLSKIIATGNPAAWKQFDKNSYNSNWRYWHGNL